MTVTNVSAVACSNQKKVHPFSNGDTIFVIADTTSSCVIKKITSAGVISTLTNGVIAGWESGALICLTLNGVEYIIVTWKQNGAGGSRTDNYTYGMVGSLDAGRTTITWGTAVDLSDGGSLAQDFPDVSAVVTPGSSTTAEVVFVCSATNGATNWIAVNHRQISSTTLGSSITDGGSLSALSGGWFILGGPFGVNVHTWPSATVDPATGRFFVAGSGGTVGSGKGVRFRTAANAAGTLTWAAEVEVDNTVRASDTDYGVICRWDADRSLIVVGGLLLNASTVNELVAYDSSNFTSLTNRVRETITDATEGMYGPSMVIEPLYGDVWFTGSLYSGGFLDVGYYKATRSGSTLTLGSRVSTDSGVRSSSATSAWYAAGYMRWLYASGNNAPFAVKIDQLRVSPQFFLRAKISLVALRRRRRLR